MSTSIECTNCKEVVEVTGNTVTLPFVCEDCEAAAEFQETIVPSATVKITGWETPPALDEEDATVENTTLLIADLEEQVAQLTEREQKANALIADMSRQLEEDASAIGERDRRLERMGIEIFAISDAWEKVARQKSKDYWTLNAAYERLQERGFWARVFNRG